MRTIASSTSITTTTTTKKDMVSPQPAMQQQTTWQSPVPYLFGGLAAMLGLIAFALLILACSYWKLSEQLNDNESGGAQRDVESGTSADKDSEASVKLPKVYEEKILVIMAGDNKPTFLATPVTRAALVNDKDGEKTEDNRDEMSQKVDKETDNQEHATTTIMEDRQPAGEHSQ